MKWGSLDHPENWVGSSRPRRATRLPLATPCFRPPHQTPLAHQASKSQLMLLSPPEISFISGQLRLQPTRGLVQSQLILGASSNLCFLLEVLFPDFPSKDTPSKALCPCSTSHTECI